VGFGMFCLFRAALLSASMGRCTGLGWPKRKGIICGEWGCLVGVVPPIILALLVNCALIFEPRWWKNVVDVLAHLILGYI
jgi:hypothetical protein